MKYGKLEEENDIVLPQTIGGKNYSIGAYAFANKVVDNKSVKLPDNLISIGSYAFYMNQSFRSIDIPDSVTEISNYAFNNCGIKSLTIPANVTSIGEYAFAMNSFLQTVTFKEESKLTYLGKGAFDYCRSLDSIKLPSGVTVINNDVFSDCAKLETFTITDGVTSIENKAFRWCENLTTVTIPKSVNSIGKDVFYGCTKLTTIKYAGTIAEWQSITKDADWKSSTGTFTVVCSDGNIAKTDA